MSHIFNYPIETPEAIAFWSSDHKCNTAQAFIAFCKDREDFEEIAKRHGYTREWRDRMWENFDYCVNRPDMTPIGSDPTDFYLFENTPYWECMPASYETYEMKPYFVIVSPDVTVPEGSSTYFEATAQGSPTITYQWYKDGVIIPDAIDSRLDIIDVQENDAGEYYCEATNSVGSITSKIRNLTFLGESPVVGNDDPEWDGNPLDVQVNDSEVATFIVSGYNVTSYQWFEGGVEVEGETSNTLEFITTNRDNGRTFYCRLFNQYGFTDTRSATLFVNTINPKVTVQPLSITDPVYSNLDFHFEVSGTDYEEVKWFRKDNKVFEEIVGATGEDLTDSYAVARDIVGSSKVVSYKAELANQSQTVSTDIATVVVLKTSVPIITQHPQDTEVYEGDDAVFTVTANDPEGEVLNYQWYLDGVQVGDDSSIYTISSTELDMDGSVVNVEVRSVTSNLITISENATLSVALSPPNIDVQPVNQDVNEGDALILGLSASSSEPITYRWQVRNSPITSDDWEDIADTTLVNEIFGYDTDTLDWETVSRLSNAEYQCIVSNAAGPVTSNIVEVNVTEDPDVNLIFIASGNAEGTSIGLNLYDGIENLAPLGSILVAEEDEPTSLILWNDTTYTDDDYVYVRFGESGTDQYERNMRLYLVGAPYINNMAWNSTEERYQAGVFSAEDQQIGDQYNEWSWHEWGTNKYYSGRTIFLGRCIY